MLTASTLGLLVALCPPMGAEPLEDYDAKMLEAWAAGPDTPVPGSAEGGPGLVGQWLPPTAWPVIGIHAMVLPTGRVLHYSYPSGTPGSKAMVFDPVNGSFQNVSMSTDLFCSGHSMLPDGTVYVTGGNNTKCEFQGRITTFVFDPVALSWTPLQTMVDGRWYPTHLTLGDGRVLIMTGLNTQCDTNPLMEMYTPGEGLSVVTEGMDYLALYAWVHLLSDGRAVHVGPEDATFTFELGEGWTFVDHNNVGWRGWGTSVLLPKRDDQIMIMGGYVNGVASATCEIIDMAAPTPQWQMTTTMHHARAHADALILPDGTILLCGGGTIDLYGNPVVIPELFDPVTETWTELPPHVYGRMYHATTVLLPDGRVLVTGQDSGASQFWGEVYQPPYLFRGPRPVFTTAPPSVVYGQEFVVQTPDAESIAEVVLMRLSSVTHSSNFEQRHVALEFVAAVPGGDGSGTLTIAAPDRPNLAPPGTYMLFILNDLGVPSVASMVRLGPPHPADVNQDGIVDVQDLVEVVLAWGACADGPCPPDVNGDGSVNVLDLVAVILSWGATGG